uniref:Protein S100-A6-like n=1 Tax=Labrus bergylta TaxID=56723 RepID=A0A3Q3MHX2_9LABR|nr:protein S100-A6-like [Labrus bergylta]XP_020502084.1 protein S100-A6-like [Labrus bergylta]
MSAQPEPCMTNLKEAVFLLIGTYNKYASVEGCKKTLSKNEFKTLIQTEMPELLEKSTCEVGINKLFTDLDQNGDNVVDFQEFVSAVADLACCYHELCPNE